jgi:hypothetical protein
MAHRSVADYARHRQRTLPLTKRGPYAGAAVFVGDGRCVTCQSVPFMSDEKFHGVGVNPIEVQQAFIDANDPGAAAGIAYALANPINSKSAFSDGDDGRLPAAVMAAMNGAFRTRKMRCVTLRPTFVHTRQVQTFAEVVASFNAAGASSGYLGTNELQPLGLTGLQLIDLDAFLEALAGPGRIRRCCRLPPETVRKALRDEKWSRRDETDLRRAEARVRRGEKRFFLPGGRPEGAVRGEGAERALDVASALDDPFGAKARAERSGLLPVHGANRHDSGGDARLGGRNDGVTRNDDADDSAIE